MTSHSNPRITELSAAIDDTLTKTFGPDTVDYYRYAEAKEIAGEFQLYYSPPPIDVVQGDLKDGIAQAIALLGRIKKNFEEELGDRGLTQVGRALQAFEGLQLHPEIERRAGQLYLDGHYANAIEDAVKALNTLVKLRSGVDNLDGTSLMEHVFSPNNPILKFNALADKSDKDEQKGYMMLFSGAVSGLRNPRAHKFFQDDAEEALEFIAFVSLLAKLLDKAK